MTPLNWRVLVCVRVGRGVSWLRRRVSFGKRYKVRGVTDMGTRDELRDAALQYAPRSMSATDWAQVRDFTQSVTIEHVLPTEPDRATLRLTILAVAQAARVTLHQVGEELTYTDVFDPLVVEFVVSQTGLSDRAKGVRRSLLYRLGRELNPNWPFDDGTTTYGYKAPDAPYTEQEQHFFTQWAQWLSTDYQRDGATLTLALGLGAGLRDGEMARLRGSDVTPHADGCITITDHGPRTTDTATPRRVMCRCWPSGNSLCATRHTAQGRTGWCSGPTARTPPRSPSPRLPAESANLLRWRWTPAGCAPRGLSATCTTLCRSR